MPIIRPWISAADGSIHLRPGWGRSALAPHQRRTVVEYLILLGSATITDLVTATGYSEDAIQQRIEELQRQRYAQNVGDGRWVLTERATRRGEDYSDLAPEVRR